MKNYYDILQVSQSASQEIIDKVYRILAKKYHPDLNLENHDFALRQMTLINEAYEVLRDARKRENYDKVMRYEKNKILFDGYKEFGSYAAKAQTNGLEIALIRVSLTITAVAVVLLVLYLTLSPIIKPLFNQGVLKKTLSEKEVVPIIHFPEARSQGLWKDGLNKERHSRVLGNLYTDNLIQEIKISGFKSSLNAKDYEENFCTVDYMINNRFSRLKGYVGVDDETKNSELLGKIQIFADGKEIFTSKDLEGGYEPQYFDLDISEINRLQIRFEGNIDKLEKWYFSDSIKLGLFEGVFVK